MNLICPYCNQPLEFSEFSEYYDFFEYRCEKLNCLDGKMLVNCLIELDKTTNAIVGYNFHITKNQWVEGDRKENYTAIIEEIADQYFPVLFQVEHYFPIQLNEPWLPQVKIIASKLEKYNLFS